MAAVREAAVSAVHLLQVSSISWGCSTHPTADVICTTPQRTRADLVCTTILSDVQGENMPLLKMETPGHTDAELQVPWTHTGRSLNCSDLGPCRHLGHDTGQCGLNSPSAPHHSTSSTGNCNHHPLPSRHSNTDSMSQLLQGRSGTRRAASEQPQPPRHPSEGE